MTRPALRTRSRRTAVGVLTAAVVAVAGCSTAPTPSPAPDPAATQTIEPAPEQDAAASAALAAYTTYWQVTDAALASPGSRDWRPAIQEVARGQALEAALAEVENYVSLPAHTEGSISREPTVVEVTTSRVSILDCVDLGDSRLISDTTGEVFDDQENRVQRFHLRAQVVAETDGRWLVEQISPALDEPC